jgi:metallo-beta-lactamase class B
MVRAFVTMGVILGLMAGGLRAQTPEPACSMCAQWNVPQQPFRIYGNTYYVGTHGLSSILIVSDRGMVLIDGALRESAPLIAANIKTLGFRVQDVKLILNSHVHHDHAGGIAELQRLTGARVVASGPSAAVLKSGGVAKDDPQYGDIRGIDPVANVSTVADGETLHVGNMALTAHLTPGHTPGGTTWTWDSCEGGKCEHMVYVDSVTAVSADGYKFTQHPELVSSFERSLAFLDSVPCDVLLTPHPEASDLLARAEAHRTGTGPDALVDPKACQRFAAHAREKLKARLESEKP